MASDTRTGSPALLTGNDPSPVAIVNPSGASPFLLIGDHAGNRVPQALGDLGLDEAERHRHIAWDIGIAGLGERLAARLDAVFVHQRYSRLVVDCNRSPAQWDAIAPVSDHTPVPANAGLDDAARARRFADIHEPYHAAIAAEIARRDAAGQPTILIALHSFTPALRGAPAGTIRPWQIGVLHDRGDVRFAHKLLERLHLSAGLTVGDNEPYRMDLIDYTVPRHAYPCDRPYAELELRQDLIADGTGQDEWAERLAVLLPGAAAALS